MDASDRKLWRAYIIITVAMSLFFMTLYLLFPAWRKALVRENSIIENLSALFALAATGIGLKAWFSQRDHPWVLLVIPVITFFFFLEEVSWGEELLKYQLPVVYGRKLHSVHDLVPYTLWAIRDYSPMLLYGLIAVFGTAGTTGAFLLRQRRTSLQNWLRVYPPFSFFLLALALIAVAQISDVEVWYKLAVHFMEELLETNASLAFLFAALALRGGRRTYQVVPSLS